MEKPNAKWFIDIQLQSLCIAETWNTNTVVFNELDWKTARAKTVQEAEALASQGFTKYDIIGETHLYRKLRFDRSCISRFF